MVAITGDTLDTTPPYNSTPGDIIFKRQIVITGACFLPCYTTVYCVTIIRGLAFILHFVHDSLRLFGIHVRGMHDTWHLVPPCLALPLFSLLFLLWRETRDL